MDCEDSSFGVAFEGTAQEDGRDGTKFGNTIAWVELKVA